MSSPTYVLADPWRRFAAWFIDVCITGMINYFVSLVLIFAIALFGGTADADSTDLFANTTITIVFYLSYVVIALLVTVAYFYGFSSRRGDAHGQTLGKQALGIRVVLDDGTDYTFKTALVRDTLGRFVSGSVCALGYFWSLWDPSSRTWHDMIAKTHVVLVPPTLHPTYQPAPAFAGVTVFNLDNASGFVAVESLSRSAEGEYWLDPNAVVCASQTPRERVAIYKTNNVVHVKVLAQDFVAIRHGSSRANEYESNHWIKVVNLEQV